MKDTDTWGGRGEVKLAQTTGGQGDVNVMGTYECNR